MSSPNFVYLSDDLYGGSPAMGASGPPPQSQPMMPPAANPAMLPPPQAQPSRTQLEMQQLRQMIQQLAVKMNEKPAAEDGTTKNTQLLTVLVWLVGFIALLLLIKLIMYWKRGQGVSRQSWMSPTSPSPYSPSPY